MHGYARLSQHAAREMLTAREYDREREMRIFLQENPKRVRADGFLQRADLRRGADGK